MIEYSSWTDIDSHSFSYLIFATVDWDTSSKGFCVTGTQMKLLLLLWSTASKLMKVKCKRNSIMFLPFLCVSLALSNPSLCFTFYFTLLHRNHHHCEGRLCPCRQSPSDLRTSEKHYGVILLHSISPLHD